MMVASRILRLAEESAWEEDFVELYVQGRGKRGAARGEYSGNGDCDIHLRKR